MSSSQTEPQEGGTGVLGHLDQVVSSYRGALEALASGDTAKAENLVRLAGAALNGLSPEELGRCSATVREAQDLHGQLTAIAGATHQQVGEQLQELRGNRKALGGYGGRSKGAGKRLNREG